MKNQQSDIRHLRPKQLAHNRKTQKTQQIMHLSNNGCPRSRFSVTLTGWHTAWHILLTYKYQVTFLTLHSLHS